MKMPRKQTPKKKPINVQLSKEDLKELLTVLKDFMLEEMFLQNKGIILKQSLMLTRINALEMVENNHRKEIHKLKQHCSHEDEFVCVLYAKFSADFAAADYRCKRCGRETRKYKDDLTKKEKKSLQNLGVKI